MRRLFLLLALLLTAAVRPARAQGGMPDMSKAPPRIQTIWRKVMSGGTPTEGEARALSDYIAAQRDAIVAGAKARAAAASKLADSVKSANDATSTSQTGCPAPSPALAGVSATAPGAGAAAQFLAEMRSRFLAQESAAGRHQLEQLESERSSAVRLNFIASVLAANGNAGAAVVTYTDAARQGGPMESRVWSGLGAALELAGDDAHATTAFRRALAIGPRTGLAVYGLGVAYANMGDLTTGIPLLTEATRLAPSFGLSWDALGRAQSCTGHMNLAIAAMQQAQEVDWIESREEQIFGPESDDDKVEARKPLPTPHGVAPIPPPTPPAFPFQVPSIPGDWLQSRHFGTEMLIVSRQYAAVIRQMIAHEQTAENAAQRDVEAAEAAAGPAAGFEFDVNIDNRREVNAATDRVDRRMAARSSLIMAQFDDREKAIANRAAKEFAAIEQTRQKCTAAHPDSPGCELRYCKAAIAHARTTYAANRGAALSMMGGMSQLEQKYDRAMRAWFMYAMNPVTRVRLDMDRRQQIANIEQYIYVSSVGFGMGSTGENLISECNAAARAAAEAKAARDSAAKAGKCGNKKLNVDVVLGSVYMDCNNFRIHLLAAQLEIRGATAGRHGELFLGLGVPSKVPLIGAAVGMQANFGQNGHVTTAGIGVHGSVGNWLVGTENAEETVNLRSSGPATEGETTFTTGAAFQGDLGAFPGHYVSATK